MPEVQRPDDLMTELDDIKRRLKALEGTPQLSTATITEGSLRLRGEDGFLYASLGLVRTEETNEEDESWGVRVVDHASQVVPLWVTGAHGLKRPWSAHPWVKVNDPGVPVTANVFDRTYSAVIDLIGRDVSTMVPFTAAAGTVGEIRLSIQGVFSQAQSSEGASGGSKSFMWRHELPLEIAESAFIEVQARRVSGTGTFVVYPPSTLFVGSMVYATSSGIPDYNRTEII